MSRSNELKRVEARTPADSHVARGPRGSPETGSTHEPRVEHGRGWLEAETGGASRPGLSGVPSTPGGIRTSGSLSSTANAPDRCLSGGGDARQALSDQRARQLGSEVDRRRNISIVHERRPRLSGQQDPVSSVGVAQAEGVVVP